MRRPVRIRSDPLDKVVISSDQRIVHSFPSYLISYPYNNIDETVFNALYGFTYTRKNVIINDNIYIRVFVSSESSQVRRFIVDEKWSIRPLNRPDAHGYSVYVVYIPSGREPDLMDITICTQGLNFKQIFLFCTVIKAYKYLGNSKQYQ